MIGERDPAGAAPAPEDRRSLWRSAARRPAMAGAGVALLIVAASVLPYLSTLRNSFLNWDDYALILDHPFIRAITWHNLAQLFTPGGYGAYQPIRDLSYMFDFARARFDPVAYHATNLALYATTNLAAYALLRAMGSGRVAGLAGALVFALHPVHVESVAWLAARKEVLAGTFFFSAAAMYLRARRAQGSAAQLWYALSLLSALLASLSKPVTVTLPAVLALMEWGVLRTRGRDWRRAAVALLPYVLLAAALTAITLRVSAGGATLKAMPEGGPRTLLLTWPLSTVIHVGLLVWPLHLSARYPNVFVQYWTEPSFLLAAASLAGLAGFTVIVRRRWPEWVLAVLWFLVTLAPVSNFVPISTLVADRYVFLPSFALAIVASSIATGALRSGRGARAAAAAGLMLVTAGLTLLTLKYVAVWANNLTLWGNVVNVQPVSSMGRFALANVQAEIGNYEAAITEYRRALSQEPNSVIVRVGLGHSYAVVHRLEEAIECFRTAAALDSTSVSARVGLADALLVSGRWNESLAAYDTAAAAQAPVAWALTGRARALYGLERHQDAITCVRLAMAEDPAVRTADNYLLLGRSYVGLGRAREAVTALSAARKLDDRPEIQAALAEAFEAGGDAMGALAILARLIRERGEVPGALAMQGRLAARRGRPGEAVAKYRAALAIDSTAGGIWNALAEVERSRGRFASAESAYAAAARQDPGGRSLINLAAFRIEHGRLAEADSALRRARRILGDDPDLLYNEACLAVRRGQPDSALAILERAAARGLRGAQALAGDPDLSPLRARPGFRALVALVGRTDSLPP